MSRTIDARVGISVGIALSLALLTPAAAAAQSSGEGSYPVSPKRPSFSVSTSVAPGSSLELELVLGGITKNFGKLF